MRYGFVMDQTKCIGCHACTVACKAEHDVPLGAFRTWVTYSETGTFPNSRRHFQVNRCNHCENAPCVTVCPTGALFKRDDGIVDFDTSKCIGCKACMAACPYDAIYIDPVEHTAQKCNYCAHRLDRGMLPACVDVCPEQAIIAGDLDDPESLIARTVSRGPVSVRKPEQGTRPQVFYLGADASTLDPTFGTQADTYVFSGRPDGRPTAAYPLPMASGDGVRREAGEGGRRIYDTPHLREPWGPMVSLYLWTKSIAAGVGGVGAGLMLLRALGVGGLAWEGLWVPVLALVFLVGTTGLLIGDLKHPERFYLMFVKPHWTSWLVRGGVVLTLYGAGLALWIVAIVAHASLAAPFWGVMVVLAALTAGYSAFLFGQAEARDFWQSPVTFWHLLSQAVLAGGAAYVLATGDQFGRWLLFGAVAVHVALALTDLYGRHATSEAAKAADVVRRGRLARTFWGLSLGVGGALALGALAIGLGDRVPASVEVGALCALAGLAAYEHVWVRAGQSVPLS